MLLESADDAYRARLALIEAAEVSIDIQYYIWEFDRSGRAITDALVRAAERGVRVRALIDGFRVDDKTLPLLEIDRHPRIEVRLYNAFRSSFRSNRVRYTELLADFSRLNQRMHHKVLAVDGVVAIIGGRNVADEYFGLSPVRYFHDRDVLIAGALVRTIAGGFDRFWNSPYALAVSRFEPAAVAGLPALEAAPAGALPGGMPLRFSARERIAVLDGFARRLTHAPASLVESLPGPVFDAQRHASSAPDIDEMFLDQVAAAKREILIQTPYLSLTTERARQLRAALQRGVQIVLHTNSLASTDWVIVQHGYVQERRKLLKWGARLHELRPHPATCCGARGLSVRPGKSILHPKTVVFDRQRILVGSFNLDQRSVRYNSEVGVLIDSAVLASHAAASIEQDVAAQNSWRLTLDDSGRLGWLDESVEPARIVYDEPETGFLEQFISWLGYFLPIDRFL